MSNSLAKTFRTLAATANQHARGVLALALDVPDDNVQAQAVTAILQSRDSRGHVEVIRRLERLTPELREKLEKHSGMLAKAIRQCLFSGEDVTQQNAIELVCSLEMYDLIPTLLSLLTELDEGHKFQRLYLETINELVTSLYQHVHHTQGEKPYLRNAELVRLRTVTALEQACVDLDFPGHDQIIENLLILGDLQTNEIGKMLKQDGHPSRSLAEQLLLESDHPGIMQHIVDMMGLGYPDPLAFCCIVERGDPEFICHLLRNWPRALTVAQRKNYKQIGFVSWLDVEPLYLEVIPAELHMKLLHFLTATDIPQENRLRAAEWVVSHGQGEARRIATEMLEDVDETRLQFMISTSLESEDEDVQVWATSQLRARKAPEAFTELIDRLDSPMAQVQQVAREELEGFNLDRILDLYEQLEPHVCKLAGDLIQKIDPETTEKLIAELTGPMRSKRIRAAKAAFASGLHMNVLETIQGLLEDSDDLVRRTALDILSQVPGEQSRKALEKMLEDPNARIREAAERALLSWENQQQTSAVSTT